MRALTLAVLAALTVFSPSAEAAATRHVIVIAMENKDAEKVSSKSRGYIYGNTESAPFLNGALAQQAARAANFNDGLPGYNSEPHYIVMEAGTHSFADTAFTCDNDPGEKCSYLFGALNWTKSRDHLTAQMEAATPPVSWMTYQEDIDPKTTGACPVRSAGTYAAKHNPFVFFSDVSGAPPDADNAHCIAHTRDLARFSADMQAGTLASYVFITPNLCHDMHGHKGCKDDGVAEGDEFLKSFLPPVIDWANGNDAVIFVMWDEGRKGLKLPFYAAGAGVRPGHESTVDYSHRSVVKTIERIFGLPVLDAVRSANDLSDMFAPGVLP